MAGTIICDYIRTDANKLSLNVGNTTFATINAGGFYSNTGTQIIDQNGKINYSSVAGFKNGITEFDEWYVNTGSSISGNTTTVLTSNWSRSSNASSGAAGSGMSQSSGIFTFPSTGVYAIDFTLAIFNNSPIAQVVSYIELSTDGTNFASWNYNGMYHSYLTTSLNAFNCVSTRAIFDVQNTSTHKIRFAVYGSNPFTLWTGGNGTNIRIVRLGDT
jgi:hypothetical protein